MAKNLRTCAITQRTEKSYWDWDWSAVGLDPAGMTSSDWVVAVQERLEQAGLEPEDVYGIIHDKDVLRSTNLQTGEVEEQIKPQHVHLAIRFSSTGGAPLAKIAAAVGVEVQYVEKPQRGRYAWDGMLSYLIHAKDKAKHQYSYTEVAHLGDPSKDYEKVYAERKLDWEQGAAVKSRTTAKRSIDWLVDQVANGVITEDQIMLDDDLFEIMKADQRRVDDAFNLWARRRMAKAKAALNAGLFSKQTIFITGQSGVGKTQIAKEFCDSLISSARERGERWSVCRTASSNSLDQYRGEEILLMDDVRGSSMDVQDWLNLLDPYNASPATARYRNKEAVAPQWIIITASISPYEFFTNVPKKSTEDFDQFIRRLVYVLTVYRGSYEMDIIGKLNAPEVVQVKVGGIYRQVIARYGAVDTIEFNDQGETIDFIKEKINDELELPFSGNRQLMQGTMIEHDPGLTDMESEDGDDVQA